jgi:DnaK suppressor protein
MAIKKNTIPIKKKRAASPKASAKGKVSASQKKKTAAKPAIKSLAKHKALKHKVVLSAKKVSKKPSATVVKTETKKKQKGKMTRREELIQQIRTNLLRQKETLLSEAEAALNELPGQTIFPDLGDQATAETDRNFMLRLRGREQRLLKKIDEAISRIDNGIFGICDDCGEEIELKRLEARPVTTMCIECKTLQEEEEKLREQ